MTEAIETYRKHHEGDRSAMCRKKMCEEGMDMV